MISNKIKKNQEKEQMNIKKNQKLTLMHLVEAAAVALLMVSFFSKIETNYFLSWMDNIGSINFLFNFVTVFAIYPLVLFIGFTIFDSKKIDTLLIVSFLIKETLLNIDDDHCLGNIKQLIEESSENNMNHYMQDDKYNKDLAELNKIINSYQANKLNKEKTQWVLKELLNREEQHKECIQSREKTSIFLRFKRNKKR